MRMSCGTWTPLTNCCIEGGNVEEETLGLQKANIKLANKCIEFLNLLFIVIIVGKYKTTSRNIE